MFSKEFYPTPRQVIELMLKPYESDIDNPRYHYRYDCLKGKSILEPSAGKGNILDLLTENRLDENDIYAIEIDQELQATLRGKKYQVIYDDFLTYNGDLFFDLILMNPPFSAGVDHLLKAWEVIKGGDIVCLLNAEVINNPYTEKRKLLKKLIDDHGSYEMIGSAFNNSEHFTNVEIVIIRLTKEQVTSEFNFEFDAFNKEDTPEINEQNLRNEVVASDIIESLISRYEATKRVYVEYLKQRSKLVSYSQGLLADYANVLEMAEKSIKGGDNTSYNNFASSIRSSAWKNILNKSKVSKYMTSDVQRNFEQFIIDQGKMDLTRENIMNVIQHIFDNRGKIMEQAVVHVFEIFTKYHSENRCFVEGWKTNDKWKVNRKIILPYWVRYGEYMSQYDLKQYGSRFSVQFNSDYRDIDIALAHISGKPYEQIMPVETALKNHFESIGKVSTGTFDNECQSTFFDMKFFKKGTLHLTFRDENLWKQFNFIACNALKWLPEEEKDDWKKKRNGHKAPGEYNYAADNKPVPTNYAGQVEMFL